MNELNLSPLLSLSRWSPVSSTRAMPKLWENPYGIEWVRSKSHGSVDNSSSSSCRTRPLRKGETPLSPPTPFLIHPAPPHWGQGQLDKQEEEEEEEGRVRRGCLKWTNMSDSSIYSVEQTLICQVYYAPPLYSMWHTPGAYLKGGLWINRTLLGLKTIKYLLNIMSWISVCCLSFYILSCSLFNHLLLRGWEHWICQLWIACKWTEPGILSARGIVHPLPNGCPPYNICMSTCCFHFLPSTVSCRLIAYCLKSL